MDHIHSTLEWRMKSQSGYRGDFDDAVRLWENEIYQSLAEKRITDGDIKSFERLNERVNG